jgi:sulfoquinovosyltransferase
MRPPTIVLSGIACIVASGHAFQVSRLVGAPMTATTTTSSTIQSSCALQMAATSMSSNDAPPLKRNPPRRVCLMVEPTPFTHVSGYANRFKEMLKFMEKAGDEVNVLTVDSKTPAEELPKEFSGHRISHTQGFTFPLYNQISLSLDLPEMKGAQIMEKFKPDLIHVTSP